MCLKWESVPSSIPSLKTFVITLTLTHFRTPSAAFPLSSSPPYLFIPSPPPLSCYSPLPTNFRMSLFFAPFNVYVTLLTHLFSLPFFSLSPLFSLPSQLDRFSFVLLPHNTYTKTIHTPYLPFTHHL